MLTGNKVMSEQTHLATPPELPVAVERLRDAARRRNVALAQLGHAVLTRLYADNGFARLTIQEAEDILPCTLTTQLKIIARGDRWSRLCGRVARDRRLLQLVTHSRRFREAAISDAQVATRFVEYGDAAATANSMGKQLRLLSKASKQSAGLLDVTWAQFGAALEVALLGADKPTITRPTMTAMVRVLGALDLTWARVMADLNPTLAQERTTARATTESVSLPCAT
jgi:hypothetical protein